MAHLVFTFVMAIVFFGGFVACIAETGSSLIALKYNEGVVIGTDSRRLQGPYIFNNEAEKGIFINDDICIITTGNDPESQWICERTKYWLEEYEMIYQRKPTVKNAAKVVQNLCYTAFEQGTEVPRTVVCAGYNPREKKGEVYTITGSGALFEENVSANGVGAPFLLAHCNQNYRPGLGAGEGEALARAALASAAAVDGRTGGALRVWRLDAGGVREVGGGGGGGGAGSGGEGAGGEEEQQ